MREKIQSRLPETEISEADAARLGSISALERLLAYAESEATALRRKGAATWLRMARVALLRRARPSGCIDQVGRLQSVSALEGVLQYAWLDATGLRRRGVAALVRMAISTLRVGQDLSGEITREISTTQRSSDDAHRGD